MPAIDTTGPRAERPVSGEPMLELVVALDGCVLVTGAVPLRDRDRASDGSPLLTLARSRLSRLLDAMLDAQTTAMRDLDEFAAELRSQGLHVGFGTPGQCVTCGEPWPCAASRPK